jgi:hypothetical protein
MVFSELAQCNIVHFFEAIQCIRDIGERKNCANTASGYAVYFDIRPLLHFFKEKDRANQVAAIECAAIKH